MENLGINLGFFLFQLLNFLLLLFLLGKFVWPRVLNMLDQRSERIEQGLEDARAAEEARANAERERDKLLAQARAEGQKMIEEARQRADEQEKSFLRDAAREADDLRAQARAQAEEERNRILAETRTQIVSLAMAAAERLVGQSLDEKRQKAILKDFFAAAPADAKGLGKQVVAVSAVPLEADELAEIKKVTGAEQVENKVDPTILGGLILRAGDKVVDGSVRADLAALTARVR